MQIHSCLLVYQSGTPKWPTHRQSSLISEIFFFPITWLLKMSGFKIWPSRFICHSMQHLVSGVALKASKTNCLHR